MGFLSLFSKEAGGVPLTSSSGTEVQPVSGPKESARRPPGRVAPQEPRARATATGNPALAPRYLRPLWLLGWEAGLCALQDTGSQLAGTPWS